MGVGIQFLRRALAFALLVLGLAVWPETGGWGLALLAAAAVVYGTGGWLRARLDRARGWGAALRYDAVSAVVLPDALGLVMAAGLAVFPIWAGAPVPHPSAWLLWPMAALFLTLPAIAAQRAEFALRVEPAALVLRGLSGTRRVALADIARIAPWRRDLPGWLRGLAPLALAAGQPTAAGSVMLARPSTGLALHLRDGGRVVIPCDGFQAGRHAILTAARAHAIPAPAR